MRAAVTVIFNARQQVELNVDVEPDRQSAHDARSWFDTEWQRLGCEPLRPSGKVLLLDKILGVADAQGLSQFTQNPELAQQFAEQTVLALERPHVTVDLPGLVVGY